ncbi:MAG TPA: response regulator [Limnobacter sp.]|nr:response regulator [Limnobacter sp.]
MNTIHIIEDDPLQAELLVDHLSASFPSVKMAVSPSLKHFAAHVGHYDVLISDLSLPDSESTNTAEFLLGLPRHNTVVCFSSDAPVGEDLARASGNRIIFFNKTKGTGELMAFLESLSHANKYAVSKKSQQAHGH